MLLGVDTSGSVSAAVWSGDSAVASRCAFDPRRHAELLAPMTREVLADASALRTEAGRPETQITAIAAGVGPGPFTGLRVAVVTALVLGRVWNVPVIGVCSLDALVHQYAAGGRTPTASTVLAVTDARRKEVYSALYVADSDATWGWRRVVGPHVGSPVEAAACWRDHTDEPPVVVGRGAVMYADAFSGLDVVTPQVETGEGDADEVSRLALLDPLATGIAAVAKSWVAAQVDLAQCSEPLSPMYLRRPDAQEPGARKTTLTAGGRRDR